MVERAAQVPLRRPAGARHARAPDRRLAGDAARAARPSDAVTRRRCAELLGEMAAAGVLMQANIKFNGALVLQIFGDGPVKLAVAEVQPDLAFRATAKVVGEVPARRAPGGAWSTCTARAAARSRSTRRTSCPASSLTRAWCRCTATSASRCRSCREVLEHYMLQSEQLDTRLVLAADDQVAGGPADPAPAGRGRGQPRRRTRDATRTRSASTRTTTASPMLAATLTRDELLDARRRDDAAPPVLGGDAAPLRAADRRAAALRLHLLARARRRHAPRAWARDEVDGILAERAESRSAATSAASSTASTRSTWASCSPRRGRQPPGSAAIN